MGLTNNSWMETAAEKMRWAEGRQKVIAKNVANADSPGYIGRDVVSFEEHLQRADAFGHGAFGGERREPEEIEAAASWGGSFDGNSVVLEEQAILSSETEGQHRLASELYSKANKMLGAAVSSK